MTLTYDYFGAAKAGERRHAGIVMKSLGIKWDGARGQPITDSMTFIGCSEIPPTLPGYIRRID